MSTENTNDENERGPGDGGSNIDINRVSEAVNLYSTLVGVRNTELSTHWSRYNVMAAASIAIFVVFLASGGEKFTQIILEVIGFLLAAVWLSQTYFGKKMIVRRFEGFIIRLEQDLESLLPWFPRMFNRIAIMEDRLAEGERPPIDWEKQRSHDVNWRQFAPPVSLALLWVVFFFATITAERKASIREVVTAESNKISAFVDDVLAKPLIQRLDEGTERLERSLVDVRNAIDDLKLNARTIEKLEAELQMLQKEVDNIRTDLKSSEKPH